MAYLPTILDGRLKLGRKYLLQMTAIQYRNTSIPTCLQNAKTTVLRGLLRGKLSSGRTKFQTPHAKPTKICPGLTPLPA